MKQPRILLLLLEVIVGTTIYLILFNIGLGFLLNFINLFGAPFLGFYISLIAVLVNLVLSSMFVFKFTKSKLLALVAMLVVIVYPLIMFKISSNSFSNYLEGRVSQVQKQREEIVGTTKAELFYISSQPVYSDSNNLEKITINLQIKLPKTGTYQLSTHLLAKDFRQSSVMEGRLYLDGGKLIFPYQESEGKKSIQIEFDATELHSSNFDGPFQFSIYQIWRQDIEIEAAFGGGTENSATVDFIDPGSFEIGPFPLKAL